MGLLAAVTAAPALYPQPPQLGKTSRNAAMVRMSSGLQRMSHAMQGAAAAIMAPRLSFAGE